MPVADWILLFDDWFLRENSKKEKRKTNRKRHLTIVQDERRHKIVAPLGWMTARQDDEFRSKVDSMSVDLDESIQCAKVSCRKPSCSAPMR